MNSPFLNHLSKIGKVAMSKRDKLKAMQFLRPFDYKKTSNINEMKSQKLRNREILQAKEKIHFTQCSESIKLRDYVRRSKRKREEMVIKRT
jgi:hypothetical protein